MLKGNNRPGPTRISLVVAGAGTGKTTVLVEKVKSLIKYGGVPPEKILLLTFSKKAAEELRERIGRDVPGAGLQIHAGTFHSFCYSVIREFRETFAREYGFTGPPKVADESSRHDFYRDMLQQSLRFKGTATRGRYHEPQARPKNGTGSVA